MILTLAQAIAPESEAATAPAGPPFDYSVWEPSGSDLFYAAMFFGAVVLAAILAFIVLRGMLKQTRLTGAFFGGAAALAFVFGAWGLKSSRFSEPNDPVVFWILRIFAAAMILVALRVVDRLAIVPMLTHRGKVSVPRFLHQMVNLVILTFAVLIFGAVAFGWDIDRFLAGSAVVSIVLGLALQETLGNFFSGLAMQASPPFAIGHRIKCADFEGDVVDMNWRAVTLVTDEDDYILIPNSTVAKAEVINYSMPTRATARFVYVGLEYDLPPADAVAVLKQAALETADVLAKPEPIVYLEKFADSAVEYSVKFWINNAGEHEIISHRLRMHIWYRLKERGYNIPYPVRTVEHSSHATKARNQRAAALPQRIRAIAGVPLLAPLSLEQRTQLAEVASELYMSSGQVLFRQNDSGDSFYIIHKGEVEVVVTPEGSTEERIVARLKAGDFFGEMSALTGQPRTATIRAATALACVQIEKRDLLPIFERDPALMERISEIVARRNAEREAVLAGAGKTPEPEAIKKNQKSLLGRMMNFFGLSKAA